MSVPSPVNLEEYTLAGVSRGVSDYFGILWELLKGIQPEEKINIKIVRWPVKSFSRVETFILFDVYENFYVITRNKDYRLKDLHFFAKAINKLKTVYFNVRIKNVIKIKCFLTQFASSIIDFFL